MARTNRTEFALLGLLAEGPKSGYDIKREVEEALSHFWHESYGQIYPVLNRLHSHGLVERRREQQAGRPDRIEYTLTSDGRAELEQWLAEPVERVPPRNELLLKVFFGQYTDPARLAEVVEDYRAKQAAALERLRAVSRMVEAEHGSDTGYPYYRLTMDLGFRAMESVIAWADEAVPRIRAMEEGE